MTPREFQEIKSLLLDIRSKITELVDAGEKELLTPAAVCRWLKIGRSTYQRHVKAGIIVQIRPTGGRAYVERSAIQKLIDEGKL